MPAGADFTLSEFGLDGLVISAIQLCHDALQKSRQASEHHKGFCDFLKLVRLSLEELNKRGETTAAMEPVLQKLHKLVATAHGKLVKSSDRSWSTAAFYVKKEQATLFRLRSEIVQFLILLTCCMIPESVSDVQAACEALMKPGAKQCAPEVTEHVRLLHDAITSTRKDESAYELSFRLGKLQKQAIVVFILPQGCTELAEALKTLCARMPELGGLRARMTNKNMHAVHAPEMVSVAEAVEANNSVSNDSDVHAMDDQDIREALQAGDAERLLIFSCPVKKCAFSLMGDSAPVYLCPTGTRICRKAVEEIQDNKDPVSQQELSDPPYKPDLGLVQLLQAISDVPILKQDDLDMNNVSTLYNTRMVNVQKASYLGHTVVVKRIPVARYRDLKRLKDIWKEVGYTYLAARVTTHVPKVHGIIWQDAEVWLVQEHCDGSLEEAVECAIDDNANPQAGGLPYIDTALLLLELASACVAVHEHSHIAHCDIKPANVVLKHKRIRLIDFGIAEQIALTNARRTTVERGTVNYAPYEQWSGGAKATSALDVFSIGATATHAVTGRCPDHALAFKSDRSAAVPDVHPPLKELLQRMTAFLPEDRPSMEVVRDTALQIFTALLHLGKKPRFLAPMYSHMLQTTRVPQAVVPKLPSMGPASAVSTPRPSPRHPPHDSTSMIVPTNPHSANASLAQGSAILHTQTSTRATDKPVDVVNATDASLGTITDLCSAVNTHESTALEVDLDGKALQPGPQVEAFARTKTYAITKTKGADSGFACSDIDVDSQRNTWVFSCKRSVNVKCGTLDLPEGGTLVFDESCTSVTLCDLTIKGGVLVFQGKGCNVELTNTTLIRCSLLATDGARLTLSNNCASSGGGIGLALLVAGPGTTAEVSATVFKSHEQACLAEKGAQMRMDHVTVEAAKLCGVEARHDKTSVTLTECTLVTANSDDVPKDHVRALHVTAGGSVTATACQLSGGGVGVDAVGPGSKLRLASCTVSNNKADGVRVRSKASADLAECKITENLEDGVWIKGEGTRLVGQMCDSDGNKLNGFSAQEAAEMVLEQCGANGNAAAGFSQRKDAKLRANGCTANSNKDGFESAISSTATLEGCTAEKNTEAGYTCSHAGKLDLKGCKGNKNSLCGVHTQVHGDINLDGCTCSGNGKVGVWAIGAGSKAKVVNCVCEDHADFGVLAAEGAVVTLEACKLNRNNHAGVLTVGARAMLSASQCTAEGNQRGFDTAYRGSAELVRCIGTDNSECGFSAFNPGTKLIARSCTAKKNEHSGFLTSKGAATTLEGCTSANNGRSGFTCWDADSTLEAKGCTGEGNQARGADMGKGSQSKLTDCTFSNNTEAGVAAFNADTKTVLTKCTSTGNRMSGVHTQDSAAVELDVCELTDNMMAGIRVRDSGTSMRASHCNAERNKEEGFDVTHEAKAKLHGCNARNNVHGVVCRYPGTEVAAVRCVTENNDTTGFNVSDGGRMHLEDCKSMGNSDGIFASMEGSKVDARRCSITHNKDQGVWAQRDAVAELFQCTLADNANGRFQTVAGGRVVIK